MWRAFLSLVLIGTTLTGPMFCCCSLGSLAKLAGLNDAHATDGCCCSSSADPNPCTPEGHGSGHKCPCKKYQRIASSTPGNERAVLPSESQNRWELIPVCDSIPATFVSFEIAGLNATGFQCCAFPRLDCQGILRAKQALRC